MTILRKKIQTEVVPGDPASPGDPGSPGEPARCYTETKTAQHRECQTVRTSDGGTTSTTSNPEYLRDNIDDPSLMDMGTSSSNMAEGYNDFSTDPYSGSGQTKRTCTETTEEKEVTTCTEEKPARDPVPPKPPIPAQINHSKNKGWNTWSRSAEGIDAGNFMQYQVALGIEGACVGFGRDGLEGPGTNRMTHALVADVNGVMVMEHGQVLAAIKATYLAGTLLRITRQADNTVVYLAITDKETLYHVSGKQINSMVASRHGNYAYAMLYSGSDTLHSPAITTGQVQFARVP